VEKNRDVLFLPQQLKLSKARGIMELPFAVESPDPVARSTLRQSESSSLVTASSQGSFMNSSNLDSPLPPNTPQDVVLPRYDNLQGQGQASQQRISGHLVTPAQREQDSEDGYEEPEIVDFTYVNVCETDADEVDIMLEGGGLDLQQEAQRGDVLAVLLSGIMHQNVNESLVVSSKQFACRMSEE
jgi:hypothetical protein